MFTTLKDKTLSTGIKISINHKIKEFGKMLNLKLDSKNKTIELDLMLKGETEPLNVKVGSYEIIQKDNKYFLKANNLTTSREWINIVAKNYLNGQEFEIPSKIAETLKVLI